MLNFLSQEKYHLLVLCTFFYLSKLTTSAIFPLGHIVSRSAEQGDAPMYHEAGKDIHKQPKRSATRKEWQVEESLIQITFEDGGYNYSLALDPKNISPNMTLQTLSPLSFEWGKSKVADYAKQLQGANRTQLLNYLQRLPVRASEEINKTLSQNLIKNENSLKSSSQADTSALLKHPDITRRHVGGHLSVDTGFGGGLVPASVLFALAATGWSLQVYLIMDPQVLIDKKLATTLLMLLSIFSNLLLVMLFFYGWLQKLSGIPPEVIDATLRAIYNLFVNMKDAVHEWVRRRHNSSKDRAISYRPLTELMESHGALQSPNPDVELGPNEGTSAPRNPYRDYETGHEHTLHPSSNRGPGRAMKLGPQDVLGLPPASDFPEDVPEVFAIPECGSGCGSNSDYGFGLFMPENSTRTLSNSTVVFHDTICEGLSQLEQSWDDSIEVESRSGQGSVESALGDGILLSVPKCKSEAVQQRTLRTRSVRNGLFLQED